MTSLHRPHRSSITVLQSFPGRGPQTNPYLLQLVDALPESVEVRYFSWAAALLGRWDVLHLHWPERLLRAADPLRTAARHVLLILLLIRLSLSRRAVVRTVHNVAAHEGAPAIERALLGMLRRRTDSWIRLNPFTSTPARRPVATIVHGHYRDWYRIEDEVPVEGRLLFVGLVRPYKGVEELLQAFADLEGHDVALHIGGRPSDPSMRDRVAALAARDDRVSLQLRHLDDEELAHEVAQARLVVLPYRAVHNSGAALLALSLRRPVLIPENEVTVWLRERVGREWVQTYTGALTAATLRSALLAARSISPSASPDLADMEWDAIGEAHAVVYRDALASRRRTRSS